MDELEIKGKKYISSKRAAELTGYAKDYVGQLARSGKIPAVRMGRAWFVDAEAISDQKDDTEILETSQEVVPVSETRPTLSPIQRKPLNAATLRALGYKPSVFPPTWSEVSYVSEAHDLIPQPMRPGTVAEIERLLPAYKASEHPVEREVRIQILDSRMSGIVPQKRIVEKARIIKKQKASPDTALAFGVLAAAMGVFVFFASGLFIGSNLIYVPHSGAYSANILVGFEYAKDVISHYPPFQAGADALIGFFHLLGSSAVEFIGRGIHFLTNLFDFLFGN